MRTLQVGPIHFVWEDDEFKATWKEVRLRIHQDEPEFGIKWNWTILYTTDDEPYDSIDVRGFDSARTAGKNLETVLERLGAIT